MLIKTSLSRRNNKNTNKTIKRIGERNNSKHPKLGNQLEKIFFQDLIDNVNYK